MSFFLLIVYLKLCLLSIFPINHLADSFQSKSNPLLLSWPVDVQSHSRSFSHRAHMGMSMGVIRTPGILWMPELSNHRADSHQIKFIGIALAYRCATSWSFAPCSHRGHSHWCDMRSWSLEIKFIGIVLVCRCCNLASTWWIQSKSSSLELSWTVKCAMSWSLVHAGQIGVIYIKRAPGILWTPELLAY